MFLFFHSCDVEHTSTSNVNLWERQTSLPTTELLLQRRYFPLKSVSQSSWQVLLCTVGLDESGSRLKILFDSTSEQILQKKKMTHYDVLVLNSSFYSWSKSDGSFLDLGSSKKIHQEPVQPWMGLLNKQKGTLTVCGGWVCLISILKILLLLGTVSELDIFPLHNDSTYKVIVSMYLKFLFCY